MKPVFRCLSSRTRHSRPRQSPSMNICDTVHPHRVVSTSALLVMSFYGSPADSRTTRHMEPSLLELYITVPVAYTLVNHLTVDPLHSTVVKWCLDNSIQ